MNARPSSAGRTRSAATRRSSAGERGLARRAPRRPRRARDRTARRPRPRPRAAPARAGSSAATSSATAATQRGGSSCAAARELAQEQRVAARVAHDPPAQLRVGDAVEQCAARPRRRAAPASAAPTRARRARPPAAAAPRRRGGRRTPAAAPTRAGGAAGAAPARARPRRPSAGRRAAARAGARGRAPRAARAPRGARGSARSAAPRPDASLERVHGDGERDRALVLDAAPVQHQHPGRPRALADRRQQRRLAEPGFAHQGEHPARSLPHVVDRAPRRGELALASQQLHARPDGTRAPRIPRGGGSARDSPAMTGHGASVPPGMNAIKHLPRVSPLAVVFVALAAVLALTPPKGDRPL